MDISFKQVEQLSYGTMEQVGYGASEQELGTTFDGYEACN